MAFSQISAIFGSLLSASFSKIHGNPNSEKAPEISGTIMDGFAIEGQGYRNVLSRMREKSEQPKSAVTDAMEGTPLTLEAGRRY